MPSSWFGFAPFGNSSKSKSEEKRIYQNEYRTRLKLCDPSKQDTHDIADDTDENNERDSGKIN